jgi:hypothetical protein
MHINHVEARNQIFQKILLLYEEIQ